MIAGWFAPVFRDAKRCSPALTDHSVVVRIAHVRIGRVPTGHRCDPVAAGFRTGDAAVPVVVPPLQCVNGRAFLRAHSAA